MRGGGADETRDQKKKRQGRNALPIVKGSREKACTCCREIGGTESAREMKEKGNDRVADASAKRDGRGQVHGWEKRS